MFLEGNCIAELTKSQHTWSSHTDIWDLLQNQQHRTCHFKKCKFCTNTSIFTCSLQFADVHHFTIYTTLCSCIEIGGPAPQNIASHLKSHFVHVHPTLFSPYTQTFILWRDSSCKNKCLFTSIVNVLANCY